MKKTIVSAIMLTLLLTSMLTLAFKIQTVKASSLTVHNIDTGEDFAAIQEAIYDPDTLHGHTILVDAGTYYEHVTITKSISLLGENRETTIIDGNEMGIVVSIMMNDVRISGFWLRNGGHYSAETVYAGISLHYASRANVTDNIITDNYVGISTAYKHNDYEHSSYSNVISRNLLENFQTNIRLWRTDDNVVEENTIRNGIHGVTLFMSQNNTVVENILSSNGHAVYLQESCYNYVGNNYIAPDGGGIILDTWNHDNVVYENTITTGHWGIVLQNSWHNTVRCNTISSNHYGISDAGWHSPPTIPQYSDNVIYHNNVIDNTQQIRVGAYPTDIWDDGYPSGGNYWSDHITVDDYAGVNQDEPGSDGIVDEPYVIDDDNRDNYPLVEPWSPVISATIDIAPDTLHLMSKGQWITCYIELSESYNVGDIDVSTIMLEDTIPVSLLDVPAPHPVPTEIGDYDNDTIPDLMVKFDRVMVSEYILSKRIVNDYVTLTITGEVGGAPFEGEDTIRVLMTGGGTRGHK